MSGLNAKAYAQLSALIEENGLSSILGGISKLTSGNKEKITARIIDDESRATKKMSAKEKKKQLMKQIKETYPEWDLGNGKGLSISVLESARKSGVKPIPKKRCNPYFDFLAIVRRDVESLDLSPKQIVRIGACRWNVLKLFASTKGYSNKEVVKSEQLLKEVAKKYSTIEEDLNGMQQMKESKKTQKAKNPEKKTETKVKEEEEHPAAGAFIMTDSDSDDESDDESSGSE
jgi:hypothetical protein